jgi:hypothetical protein
MSLTIQIVRDAPSGSRVRRVHAPHPLLLLGHRRQRTALQPASRGAKCPGAAGSVALLRAGATDSGSDWSGYPYILWCQQSMHHILRTARQTLAGVEAMAMLAKGQVRAMPGGRPASAAGIRPLGLRSRGLIGRGQARVRLRPANATEADAEISPATSARWPFRDVAASAGCLARQRRGSSRNQALSSEPADPAMSLRSYYPLASLA